MTKREAEYVFRALRHKRDHGGGLTAEEQALMKRAAREKDRPTIREGVKATGGGVVPIEKHK